MKKTLGITSLLCLIFLTSSTAMGVDPKAPAGQPTRTPRVASALRPNSEEAERLAVGAVDGEPGKWLSGSIVGSWADGYGAGVEPWLLNQAWLTVQKSVDTERAYDLGYRVDAIFGANNLQCFGDGGFDGKWGVSNSGYAAALYQAYVEASVGKLRGKFGKFLTVVGYESDDVTENSFVTYSNMALNEPAHHCGGLFTWAPADALELNFGLVAGPDVSWQNYRGDSGILFGVTLNLNERLSLTYASELCQIHSEMGENRTAQSWGYYLLNGDSIGDQNEYLQTVTAEIELTDQLAYAFVTNYGSMEDRATRTRRYAQYGFANYLTYDLAESLSTSLRYEYYLQQVKTSGAEGRYHDLSFALKYRPAKDVFILPEIRYDRANLVGDKNNGVTGAVAFGVVF